MGRPGPRAAHLVSELLYYKPLKAPGILLSPLEKCDNDPETPGNGAFKYCVKSGLVDF